MDIGPGAIEDVPLGALFPRLSAADVESLQRAVGSLGAARPGNVVKGWDWFPGHEVFAGPESRTWVILILCVVQPSGDSDWLEFQLQVGWTDQGQYEVATSVNVGCWCEADHGTHDADVLRFVVGDEISLPHAFEACADRMANWLADPRDADLWRARADLPTRQVS
ncbi:hypothetical protein ABT095_04775 [Kitasatospora sp. NPDC002227]|uniref:hypothetical protein n=1 Tax=Kitasatospora sp. NPDC002227 TaxID=3154773 RepID=UPI00332FB638